MLEKISVDMSTDFFYTFVELIVKTEISVYFM